MFVTAIYSIKGGVGKTAAAVNLSALASYEGKKTLLIDFDPQASSSFYLKVKPKMKTTVKKLLKGKSPVENQIKATDYIHLDILPATHAFREMEPLLSRLNRPGERIREMLEPLRSSYHWVFIDCPPGMTRLAEAIFNASDLVLVPVVPTTLSVRTFSDFSKFIKENPLKPECRYLGFFSMVDRRKSLQREILNEWDYEKERFCKSSIPYLSDVEKMGIYRKPVVGFRPSSDAALAFSRLWAEIKKTAVEMNSLSV
ncbi:MAG: ParA family protein [Bacteroidota bacterium]